MAVTDYPGAPHARIKLNDTNAASGAEFRVYDTTTTSIKLTVEADTGDVELTGTLKRSGPIECYNKTPGGTGLAEFHQLPTLLGSKTLRVEINHDSTNSLAEIRASTSGYAMQVEGNTVDLNTTNATGTIAKFKTSGTSRLTMEYTSSKPRFTAASSMDYEVTGAASDLTVISGQHTTLKFGVSAAGECRFSSGGGTTLTKVDESGVWTWNDSAGSAQSRLTPVDSNSDNVFEVGLNDSVRGKILIRRDAIGNGNNRAGVLVMEAEDGTQVFLWIRVNGANYELCAARTDPGTNDAYATPNSIIKSAIPA